MKPKHLHPLGRPGAAADRPAEPAGPRGGPGRPDRGPGRPGEPGVLRAAEADRVGAEERAGGGDGDGQEEGGQLRAGRQHPEVHPGGGQGLHRGPVRRRAGKVVKSSHV